MKARGLGLSVPEDLERLAVLRGCCYYRAESDSRSEESSNVPDLLAGIGENVFSNEELAMALLSPSLPKSRARLRLGGAMLAADGNRVHAIVRLARLERSEAVVRHIAECGNRVEPDNLFWSELLMALPNSEVKSDVLPHISRFVAMTGITQHGLETVMQWIRPVVRSGT